MRPIYRLSWGQPAVIVWGGSQGKQDPREVINPVGSRGPCPEGIFQAAMPTLYHPIRMWVESGGERPGNAQQGVQVALDGRSALRASIARQGVGDAKPAHPSGQEGACAV